MSLGLLGNKNGFYSTYQKDPVARQGLPSTNYMLGIKLDTIEQISEDVSLELSQIKFLRAT
jgi:hypothetical protein